MRILLVRGGADDTRRALLVLERQHDVSVVDDPAEVRGRLGSEPVDLVVDVWPAEPMGRAAAARRLQLRNEAERLVVLPAAATEDRLALREADTPYLVAPYHPVELLRAVGPQRSARPRQRWSAGDVAVDASARTAWRGTAALDLTRKEFDLLAQLVRSPGVVQTREVLLESVWGSTAFTPNVIEVTVSNLRRKLERHGPRVVHTVRGIGYVLRVEVPFSESVSTLAAERAELLAERRRLLERRDQLVSAARSVRSAAGAPR